VRQVVLCLLVGEVEVGGEHGVVRDHRVERGGRDELAVAVAQPDADAGAAGQGGDDVEAAVDAEVEQHAARVDGIRDRVHDRGEAGVHVAEVGGDRVGADDDDVLERVGGDLADVHGGRRGHGRQRRRGREHGVLTEQQDEAAAVVAADHGEVVVAVVVEVAGGERQAAGRVADREGPGEHEVAGAVVEGDLDLGDARLGRREVEVAVGVEVGEHEGGRGDAEGPLQGDHLEVLARRQRRADRDAGVELVAERVGAAVLVGHALDVRAARVERARAVAPAAADALAAHAIDATVAAVEVAAVVVVVALGRRRGGRGVGRLRGRQGAGVGPGSAAGAVVHAGGAGARVLWGGGAAAGDDAEDPEGIFKVIAHRRRVSRGRADEQALARAHGPVRGRIDHRRVNTWRCWGASSVSVAAPFASPGRNS
jgi:hypothetical protein